MSALHCPNCNAPRTAETRDSRPKDLGGFHVICRRRICKTCDHRWTTAEVPLTALERAVKRAEAMTEILNSQSPADVLRTIADLYDPQEERET